ncbi:Transcription factor HEX [Handroanthus impetiginosus]|uniref:Transcription factor HEX n=1 Tax=Handroanthus impetiginosus TaxID=429701 RepID=A0A2G9HT48_9LAMI|nr:Transcription factor HEX [Handroanthus impetiginosus]
MAEKDDGLGLSLSLRCSENQILDNPPPAPSPAPRSGAARFPFNLFKSPLPLVQEHKSSSAYAFQPSPADRNADSRQLFRGIDVNRAVTVIDCDEEVMVSSPNSTVSSLSGKRSEREENDGERASSSLEMEDDGGDAAARKKLRLSKEQAAVLEETFKEHNTLNPKQKMALAKQLNLRPRQVEVWFQNRRARTKLKQTEVDCEYLRRCCENLTEENRRLQKEVTELRALKLSPQFYMNMSPPTTLTMCPQCERVAVSSSSSATTSSTIPTNGAGLSRQPAHHQRPMPMNSWAAIFPPQPLDSHRPRT